MDIVVDVDGESLPATLEDTAAGRAFADMLPLTLTLGDFGGGVEKVADLPGPLPTDDAPSGMKPVAGDITYYSPWGNLAIFRRGFQHASGLVKLGRLTDGFEALDRSGSITVTLKPAP